MQQKPRRALQPRTPLNFDDPCAVLADAKAKYYALLSGGATQVIETPQLGRVEYTPADPDRLARFISTMEAQCAQASGQRGLPRRPISFDTLY